MRLPLAALLSLAPACFADDDAPTGRCPRGETCSPATPDGLVFRGTMVSDVERETTVHVTAIGGTQAIELAWGHDAGTPFALPFDAVTDGTALQVTGAAASRVDVRATAAGGDRLRIVDRDGALYDRVEVTTGEVTELDLKPAMQHGVGWENQPLALWHDTEAPIVIALHDPGSYRLVDTAMTIAISAPGRVTAWDALTVDAQPAGASVTVTATLGSGQVIPTTLPVVDRVDEILVQQLPNGFATGDIVCFTARNAGLIAYGVPYAFTVTGPTVLVSIADVAPNCVQLGTVTATDLITLTATAGGTALSVSRPGSPSARVAPQ